MIQLAKEKTHAVNFHTPTYIGSLRKVGKYAKALNGKATEQLETCNEADTALVAALKEVVSKADVLRLEANTYVAARDGDHYLYYIHGADAVKNAREQRVDALAGTYSEILREYQDICKKYGI